MGWILPLKANRGESTVKRAFTESESVARYLLDRHQIVGERIYRVRFGNANGFMAWHGAFFIRLSSFFRRRKLDYLKGMAIPALSGMVGRLDLLPASK